MLSCKPNLSKPKAKIPRRTATPPKAPNHLEAGVLPAAFILTADLEKALTGVAYIVLSCYVDLKRQLKLCKTEEGREGEFSTDSTRAT